MLTLSDEAQVNVSLTKPDFVLNILVGLSLVAAGRSNEMSGRTKTIEHLRERRQAALVVGTEALVVESHETIALEVGNGSNRSVDGELTVVGAKIGRAHV